MGLLPAKGMQEQEEQKASASPEGSLREIWKWMKLTAAGLLLVVFIHQYFFHFSTVRGISMEPTLVEGEWLFINKTIRLAGTPQRGDVIVIKRNSEEERKPVFLVKRVVAVGGDEVHIRRGRLYVNGEALSEPYTGTPIEDGGFEPYTIEEGHLFVMGDNRHRYASHDSRSFGAVPLEEVVGRAEWIIWPLDKWRRL
ncbi:signal peptidase I [Paenibacillus caseinilyticus]|uniref:Signal peptidase I n=1 Tax=Paenibacillus mucilaginosus K02 TaxID=997761 RepID=I0BB49_9BACL|nr:signal peptidase I [Paenibacillus mucilaginosus]AFH59596.1 signal peptidase I [Paenibacillus mucilaginosus K02]